MNAHRIIRSSVLFVFTVVLAVALPWLLTGHGPTAYGASGTGYVSSSGSNTPTCGTAGSPCNTIGYAITRTPNYNTCLLYTSPSPRD